jgi:hypothetical protein
VDEQHAVIDGKKLTIRTLETTKEKDGVRIPHILREITCEPEMDLETVRKYAKLRENIGGPAQPILARFLEDAK